MARKHEIMISIIDENNVQLSLFFSYNYMDKKINVKTATNTIKNN